MPRYIDADALCELGHYDDFEEYVVDWNDIDHAPTADVVEVVRCKDCDNWTDENGREGLCQVWSDFEISHLRYTPKDGYCSEGERREDAT